MCPLADHDAGARVEIAAAEGNRCGTWLYIDQRIRFLQALCEKLDNGDACGCGPMACSGHSTRVEWLPGLDSNQNWVSQSHLCYHYTTRQWKGPKLN